MVDNQRQPRKQFNHMVDKASPAIDRVFRALASAPRREILRRAARRRCTVTELAKHFDMSLAAVSKHVGVLDDANLLVRTRDGRRHWRRFNPGALQPALATIEELQIFWTQQLDGLERFFQQPSTARSAKRKRRTRR